MFEMEAFLPITTLHRDLKKKMATILKIRNINDSGKENVIFIFIFRSKLSNFQPNLISKKNIEVKARGKKRPVDG